MNILGTKLGRPTDNPRVVQTRIRMSIDESNMLIECAKKLQMTKTDVVIMGIKKVYAEITK